MEKTKIERRKQILLDHLVELRNHLLVISLSVGLIGGGAFFVHDKIEIILMQPLGQNLYYSAPGGGFDFVFKLCISTGIIFSLPLILRQLLKFMEPVISSYVRTHITRFTALSLVLALIGITFAYSVTLPATLNFLNNFTTEGIKPLIATNEYISFIMTYLLAFALIFQLPLIIWIINNIKPLDPGSLLKHSRFVFVGSFIFAAILTPTPDIMNQLFMAVPMIALYIASVLIVMVGNWRRSKTNGSLSLPKPARVNPQPPPVVPVSPRPLHQAGVPIAHPPILKPALAPAKAVETISNQKPPAMPSRVISDIAPARPSASRTVVPAAPPAKRLRPVRQVYRSMDIIKPTGLVRDYNLKPNGFNLSPR